MARMLFGGETADVYLHEDDEGDLHAYGPLVAKFYDGFDESASPVVDLLTADEEAIEQLAVHGTEDGVRRGQLPTFWGPDEVYELWVSVNNSPRQLLRPVNVGSSLADTKESVDDLFNSGDPNPFGTALIDLIDVDRETVEFASEGTTLVKTSAGVYASGSSPIPLSDIIWVAAADAPANFKGAPYVCDGSADQEEINTALSNVFGLKVGLSPGNFAIADPIRMHFSPDPQAASARARTQYLIGSGQTVTRLNVLAGVNAGIYFYNHVNAHVWDLTINVTEQRAIWAFRTGGAMLDYRAATNGSIRRVTVSGPSAGTHGNWAISLKSVDNFLVEDVTTMNTRFGIELVSESAEQKLTNVTYRNCRVTIISNDGQCYRSGTDAGEVRQLTYDTCHAAAASPTQTGTEGYRVAAVSGQSYGIRMTNCTAVNLMYTIHTWPNATDVDADFGYVEPRQGGYFVWSEGSASRYRVSEYRTPASLASASLMHDVGVASMPNQYWHHVYTMGASTFVGGTLGNGVVRRGVAEGLGTLSASMQRNPSQQIDRRDIDPVSITNTATLGTVATNFTVLNTRLRHTPDGKVVYGWFQIRSTNAISPISGTTNWSDTLLFTLNSAYRPTDSVYALWSSGTATGGLFINSNGTITLTTGNQPIAASGVLTFTFAYVRD